MQNGFDAPLPGFGMLFAQNLAMKEYYDSLSQEIGQEAEEHRLEMHAADDMKIYTNHFIE